MNEVATCLLGAKVIVTPDVEVTEEGVEQKEVDGIIVAVYLTNPMPNVPMFRAPHLAVLVDDKVWPCVPMSRTTIVSIPELEPTLAITP